MNYVNLIELQYRAKSISIFQNYPIYLNKNTISLKNKINKINKNN